MRADLCAAAACLLVFLVTGASGETAVKGVPEHHTLSVRIDPATGAISGTDHVRLSAPATGQFTLAPGLEVVRLVVDGEKVVIAPAAGIWRLDLKERDRHEIAIEYRGKLQGQDDGRPMIIEPAGTFLVGEGWYPSFGSDVLSFDLSVAVPPGQIAVAPGKILRETTSADGYAAQFVSEAPAEEVVLFAGPYRMSERRQGELRLRTYFHPDVADLADLYLSKTAEYVDLYAGWIGPYPFANFHVVSGQMPLGLGFPGLTYIGTQVLRLPFIPETSLGHEVLHSWWGNGVLIDASAGNWAEGLTTFMADYAYAERKSDEEARDMRLRWLRDYAALPPERDRPLTAFRSRVHTASQVVGYHKAAMVFLMLRDELGRPVFDAGLRRFWSDQRFRRAAWRDLRKAFEAAAGHSLDAFFAQWLERTGAPSLVIGSADLPAGAGGGRAELVLNQAEPAYRLQVPVEIRAEQARRTERVRLDAGSGRYELELPKHPRELCVDPEYRLFRRLDVAEVPPILRSALFDTRARVVIAAGSPDAAAAAREVAAQLLESEGRFADATAPLPDGTLVLVGTEAEVAELLDRAGLPSVPPGIAGKGTARAWASRRASGAPLLVVAAETATALRQAGGPLPHYGSRSFVVFEGRQAVDKGIWPVKGNALCVGVAARGAAAPVQSPGG